MTDDKRQTSSVKRDVVVGILRNMAQLEQDQADAASIEVAATVEGLKETGLWSDVAAFAAADALREAAEVIGGELEDEPSSDGGYGNPPYIEDYTESDGAFEVPVDAAEAVGSMGYGQPVPEGGGMAGLSEDQTDEQGRCTMPGPGMLIWTEDGGWTVPSGAGYYPPQAAEELGFTQANDLALYDSERAYQGNLKRLQAYEEIVQTDAMNTARQYWNMAAQTQQFVNAQFMQHQGNVNALTQQMLAGHVERIAAVNGVAIESMLESVGIRASERMESNIASQQAADLIATKAAHAFAQQVSSEALGSSLAGRISSDLLTGLREYLSK